MNSYEFELTNEVLSKINTFARKPLTKERVYAFPVILCDNETDRDGERFSEGSLEKLAALFVGKTGIFDHDPKGRNQTARIFETFIDRPEGKLTSYGDPYVCLAARAYMVRTERNKALIDEIDAGIKKEVSISCAVSKKTCSVCGRNIYKDPCPHVKGREYGGKKCFVSLDEPTDAYEWSFVAVPAQVSAGVTKTFGKSSCSDSHTSEDSRLKDEHCAMYTELTGRVKALFELTGKGMHCCEDIISRMSVSELIGLEKSLARSLTSPASPQLEAVRAKNESYRINNN